MNKLFGYGLALAFCIGTTGLLASSSRTAQRNLGADAALATDGAFRDGLFVGKLTAENGRPLHPPTGRWSNQKDRDSFATGYQQGYSSFLASAK